jgi:hypothetical protein
MSRLQRVLALSVLTIAVATPARADDWPNTLAGCLAAAEDQYADCLAWGFGIENCTNTSRIVDSLCHIQYAT